MGLQVAERRKRLATRERRFRKRLRRLLGNGAALGEVLEAAGRKGEIAMKEYLGYLRRKYRSERAGRPLEEALV